MAYFVDESEYLEHYGVKGMRWGHRKADYSSEGYTTGRKNAKRVKVETSKSDPNTRYISGDEKAGVRGATRSLEKQTKKLAAQTTRASKKGDIFGTMSNGAKYLNTVDSLRAQAKNDADKYFAKANKVDAKQAKRVQKGKALSEKLSKKSGKYVLKAANNERIRKDAELTIQKNIEVMTKGGYQVRSAGTERAVVSTRNTAAIIGGVAVAGLMGGVAGALVTSKVAPKKVAGTQYSLARDNVVSL